MYVSRKARLEQQRKEREHDKLQVMESLERPFGWVFLMGEINVLDSGHVSIEAPCGVTGQKYGVVILGHEFDEIIISDDPVPIILEMVEPVRTFLLWGTSPKGKEILREERFSACN